MEYDIPGFQYKITSASKQYKVVEGVYPKLGPFLIVATLDSIQFTVFDEDYHISLSQSITLQSEEIDHSAAIDWMLTILDLLGE